VHSPMLPLVISASTTSAVATQSKSPGRVPRASQIGGGVPVDQRPNRSSAWRRARGERPPGARGCGRPAVPSVACRLVGVWPLGRNRLAGMRWFKNMGPSLAWVCVGSVGGDDIHVVHSRCRRLVCTEAQSIQQHKYWNWSRPIDFTSDG
jgi:hypothetical protein